MTLITYQRRAVAMAGPDRFYLAPHIDRLANGHPLKTFVCFLALYARDVQTRALPGGPRRYLPRRAERYAREALIPAHNFAAIQHRPDRQLADHFGVPLKQIARRREDLAGGTLATASRRRPTSRRWCQPPTTSPRAVRR